MGWFSIINNEFKPSDEYLRTHKLEGYEEGDTCHEDYDVSDDVEAMNCARVCEKCGKTFTLDDAMVEYGDYFNNDFDYMDDFCGDVCGSCAIEKTEEEMEEQYIDE